MRIAIASCLLCLAFAAGAGEVRADGGPDTRPVSLENRAILGRSQGASESRPLAAPKVSEPLSMWRIGSALGLVLASIFGLRWASRKVLGLPVGAGATSAVAVLGRSIIGPRQQVLLIRVGRRILVVANSGATMNSLCEITDPDEVATILGQLNRPRHEGEPGAFASLFARAGDDFETEPRPRSQDGDAELTATRAEIGGLLDKVRTLSRSFRRA